MVQLRHGGSRVSLVGILYHSLVQSHGRNSGFLSRESFHELYRGSTHVVDRVWP